LFCKTGLTKALLKSFLADYQGPRIQLAAKNDLSEPRPFVYVDSHEIKLLADMIDSKQDDDSVCAITIAGDGLMEIMAIGEC